jgi:hypothetical protein
VAGIEQHREVLRLERDEVGKAVPVQVGDPGQAAIASGLVRLLLGERGDGDGSRARRPAEQQRDPDAEEQQNEAESVALPV